MHGPILVHDRLDAAVARLSVLTAGGEPQAFLPEWDAGAPKEKQSDDEMIAKLRAIQKRAKKRKKR